MKNLKKHLLLMAVLAVLAIAGTMMNSHPASASGSAPVTIVNPLPVPVTGSTTVSGTIAATQSGTWNVGLTGNSVTNPLIVRDVDNAARSPFQMSLCVASTSAFCVNPQGPGLKPSSFLVPTDRHLVIEYVSGICTVVSVELFNLGLDTTAGGTTAGHVLHPTPGVGEYEVAQTTRIYADPGSLVTASEGAGLLTGGSVGCNLTISGYTVTQ